MINLLIVAIALVSLLLIASILIQNPKGGGIDQTFGGGAQQLLGAARSADFIEKATWYLIAALIILCIVTAISVGGVTGNPADIPLQSAPGN